MLSCGLDSFSTMRKGSNSAEAYDYVPFEASFSMVQTYTYFTHIVVSNIYDSKDVINLHVINK